MKDLSSNPKDLEGGNVILGLLILGSGSTANAVGSNMLAVAQFIRSGGAYLAIESLVGGYEMALNQDSAQIDERRISLQINAENLRKQVAILENLRKQFPQPAGNGAQQLDLKSSDAKYLPLTTQLIAVNADLAENQENQALLRSKQEELAVLNQFVVAAKALFKNEFDGLKLVQQMLKLQAEIEKGISNPSLYQKRILGQIKLDLVSIDTRYGVGLEIYQQSAVLRGGMWLYALGGLVLGATLVMFSLLAQGFWQRHLKLRSLA
jgi:hypothetical protein